MVAESGEQARDNGDKVTTYDVGMCQKFVRDPCWRVPSLYGSAIDAWHGSTQKHAGDRNPPTGAPCYYSGGNYGHAVTAQKQGSGKIRTTDAPSSGKVSDQDLDWPERAWGYKYLGWTGDINGVDLPIGGSGDEDEMELDDKIANWSPDQGSEGDLTVGQTLNQARGYAEDSYDRVKALQDKVNKLDDKVDKILNAVT